MLHRICTFRFSHGSYTNTMFQRVIIEHGWKCTLIPHLVMELVVGFDARDSISSLVTGLTRFIGCFSGLGLS